MNCNAIQMNLIIIVSICLLHVVKCSFYPNSIAYGDYESSEETSTPVLTTIKPKNCSTMKFGCESCTDLVMCIDTEYGFMKQYVQCPAGTTCLRDKCTKEQNPLCDGTADIPFKCHLPGMFPDPFDCKKYHFCVPESNQIINHTMKLKHFEHSCFDDMNTEYQYDPKSTYCKFKLEKGCTKWPIPLCQFEGHSAPLTENKSIFFVCELVQGHLYPHLYNCPHGELYNDFTTKCETESRHRYYDYTEHSDILPGIYGK